jgi:hypothetical protein
MSDFQLSYPNSDHNAVAPREAPTPQPDPATTLAYPETGKQFDVPKGAQQSDVPAEIRALRAERSFLPNHVQHAYDAVKDHPTDGEAEKTFRAEAREQFADLGISPVEAREVVKLIDDAYREGAPSPETLEQWRRESVDQVFRQYGKDAERKLAGAKALVARDPRVKAFLNATGLGSHPKVVALLIEKAHSERARGRLK